MELLLFQAEDGIRDLVRSRGLGDVYKRRGLATRSEGLRSRRGRRYRAAAGKAGLPVDALQDRLRAQIEGVPVGLVIESGRRIPVMLRGLDDHGNPPEYEKEIHEAVPGSRYIPLKGVGHFPPTEAPERINPLIEEFLAELPA